MRRRRSHRTSPDWFSPPNPFEGPDLEEIYERAAQKLGAEEAKRQYRAAYKNYALAGFTSEWIERNAIVAVIIAAGLGDELTGE
mgnify:CR=1 FL=1|tara:strand:- start:1604 stop:1855 length:252 start_codon:yes stop_codon:yes gene_type:complete